jgi:murein DD-endopeptidase MepM/ murein hydrolase activator NlpD
MSRNFRPAIIILAICCALPLTTQAQRHPATPPKAAGQWSIQFTPSKLVNGVPIFLQVTPITPLQSMTGTWLGHDLTFDHGGGENWFVLAGVSLETKPGRYPLKVEAVTATSKHVHFEQELLVGREKYPAIELKVSKQYTEPNPEQQTEIKQAQDIKHDAFNKITPEREWSGMFAAPVNAPSSDIFGTRRVFNGVTKSVHQGLDYRVGPGTPVMAINSGTVLLARFLYFEGNCVVIDHGQGLLSLYLHLSELKVKEGEHVDRGEEVGLSGATGRATGPHLHLAVRWQGVYVNPAVLLRLPLPEAKIKPAVGM